MKNQSIHNLSGAYALDALDNPERTEFEAHLEHCPDCRDEVASLREAAALMADDAAVTPPPALRENVLAGIQKIRPLPPQGQSQQPAPTDAAAGPSTSPTTSTVVPMRRRRASWRTVLAAAAAAVVAAVGIGIAIDQPWQQDTTQLSAADRVLAASDATRVSIEFDDGSTATVVRSQKERRAVLLTRDMAAPPPGKVYELWLQDDTGEMSPAGLMSEPGDHKLLLEGDAAASTGVGITVEPEGGSPQPTTKPIALFDLSESPA